MKTRESVEAEGNTIDEAIESALRELGATREQVEIEIIADASKGILGIGRKKARIKASVRPPLKSGLGSTDDAGSEGRVVAAASESCSEPVVSGSALGPGSVQAQQILEGILRRMGFHVTVSADGQGEDGAVNLSMNGDKSGLLIGKYGQTLDALEYLVNRATSRNQEPRQRVILECASYRQRRKASLEEMAVKLGEKAKRRAKTLTMEAMSPRDRRTVHMALRDDRTLTTKSVGVGYYRKLKIIPAGERRRDRC